MPVPLQPVELLDWLDRNQFLTPDQLRELRPHLPKFADARALAGDLIRRDWLTPYQVNQIMQDRGDQLVLGALRLRERLGEGAMGQVFKAWHTRLEQVVAIKTIHKNLIANCRAMDRFRQEIEAASQLHHPNIANVRDAGEIDGRPFLVMDYVEGINLSTLVKTKGPLPVRLAVECIRQAALGLQHAFERGVVHRDVKPGNLVLQSVVKDKENESAGLRFVAADHGLRTTDICVKILDFGLARFDSERRFGPRLTYLGSTLGTVDYMAPEQAESARDADTRSDIYGLGCTLFFLLTGRPPFGGGTMAEKIGARLTGNVPSVRESRPDVPAGLDHVLQRMMARQPGDRYQAPAEVAEALTPFAAEQACVASMQLDGRLPLAAPVTAPVDSDAVPLALPVAAESRTEPAPLAEPLFLPAGAASPFSTETGNPFVDANPAQIPNAGRTAPPAGHKRPLASLNPRILVPVVGGAVLMVVLAIACSGYLVVSWLKGDKTNVDAYPPGADLQIVEAFLSTGNDIMRVGDRKKVIVKLRRVRFHGPVDLRLENLPAGVTFDKTTAAPAAAQVEVRITAPFGIDPAEADIRVVAKAKNLSAEKTLHLKVMPPG
jgi:serine/threonine-protein kinase